MSVAAAKVPAAIASGAICMVLGIGVGALGKMGYDYLESRRAAEEAAAQPPSPGTPVGRPAGAGGGMGAPPMGMGGAMGGGGGGGGQRGPSHKTQLADLVKKLDPLVNKKLVVELSDDERNKVKEQVKGLKEMDKLTDDEAEKRLNALLEVLKDKKPTMEAAGYRWPGGAGGGGRGGGGGGGGGGAAVQLPPDSNPFKEDKNNTKALDSLESALTKK